MKKDAAFLVTFALTIFLALIAFCVAWYFHLVAHDTPTAIFALVHAVLFAVIGLWALNRFNEVL